jgi:hypothetical protein
MRSSILGALLSGVLGLAVIGCGDSSQDDGSLTESALKGGNHVDAGTCHCPKGKKDEDHGKSDAGKSDEDHGKSDAGKASEDHGKPDAGKSSADHGKSGEEHGKADGGADDDEQDDETASTDEDELDDTETEARKFYPDAGAKKQKPSDDCTC